jgi:hypothetical protein
MTTNNRPERRHAARIAVDIPTLIEVVPHREADLHPNLAKVYERVLPNAEAVGEQWNAAIRDLSTNGAFITGKAVPLLSRIAFTFELEGYGRIEALGWVLWRRTAECDIPRSGGGNTHLAAGFGVLFESIPLEARQEIARLVSHSGSN